MRVEGKTTGKASFSIKRAHLEKIRAEALMNRQVPGYAFGFDADDWMAFPMSSAATMMEAIDALMRGDIQCALDAAESLKG